MDMEAAAISGTASASSSTSRRGRSISRLPARVAGAVIRGLVTFVFAAGRWIDFGLAISLIDQFDSCVHRALFLRRCVLLLHKWFWLVQRTNRGSPILGFMQWAWSSGPSRAR